MLNRTGQTDLSEPIHFQAVKLFFQIAFSKQSTQMLMPVNPIDQTVLVLHVK